MAGTQAAILDQEDQSHTLGIKKQIYRSNLGTLWPNKC